MKIKAKLTLAVGLLFLMILLLAGIGAVKIRSLSEDTSNILVANYNTLDYSRNMLKALDEMKSEKNASALFEENLKKQQRNITEIGEGEFTNRLAAHYAEFRQSTSDTSIQAKIRSDIYDIIKVNMDAIQRKSEVAKSTAKGALIWI